MSAYIEPGKVATLFWDGHTVALPSTPGSLEPLPQSMAAARWRDGEDVTPQDRTAGMERGTGCACGSTAEWGREDPSDSSECESTPALSPLSPPTYTQTLGTWDHHLSIHLRNGWIPGQPSPPGLTQVGARTRNAGSSHFITGCRGH